MTNLPDFNEYFSPDIVARFAEVNQSRSKFQIEKFVIDSQDTSEMQYVQCINELQAIYYNLKKDSLRVKQMELKIKKLKESEDENDLIEAEILEIGLEQARVLAVGQFRELDILMQILDKYPRYSREEIESKQPEYWHKRLTRQFQTTQIGGNNAGNLEALINIGQAQIELPENASNIKYIENNKKEIS